MNSVAHLWNRRFDCLTFLLLGVSLALNVKLGLQLRSLPPVQAAPATVSAGAKIPILSAEDLRGAKVTLNWAVDTRPSLVYIFSPSCHWCTRNLPNIKTLSREVNSGYRIIGISLSSDGLEKYVKDNEFTFPVYRNVSLTDGKQFALKSTPQTLIISPEGKVMESWRGAYADKVKNEIEFKLGVKLPGLAPDQKADGRSM